MSGETPNEVVPGTGCTRETLGRAAYQGYGDSRQWRTVRGDAMLPWEAQAEDVREGWRVAAEGVVAAARASADSKCAKCDGSGLRSEEEYFETGHTDCPACKGLGFRT